MKAHRAGHGVRALSRALGVSASGFYAWCRRGPRPTRGAMRCGWIRFAPVTGRRAAPMGRRASCGIHGTSANASDRNPWHVSARHGRRAPLLHDHFQRRQYELGPEMLGHRPGDHSPTPHVEDDSEIQRTRRGANETAIEPVHETRSGSIQD